MKQLYFSLLLLLSAQVIKAQIINIGDPQFKAAILNTGIDTNNDGEIQLSEASTLTGLNANSISARTFQGIEHFTNLTYLNIGSSSSNTDSENIDLRTLSNLQTLALGSFSGDVNLSGLSNLRTLEASLMNPDKLDMTGLISLEEFSHWSSVTNGPNYYVNNLVSLKELDLDGRALTWLDVGNLTNLEMLYCGENQLTSLDISNLTNLNNLYCSDNQLTLLDISHNNITGNISFSNNPITSLNIKDGNIATFYASRMSNINLQNVCCDASELTYMQGVTTNAGYTGVTFDTDCTPTPTGTLYYNIQGKNTLDNNFDGCDAGDGFLPTVEYTVSNGSADITVYTDKFGNYEFIGQAGTYTITPNIPNTNYYTISPTSITVSLPADGTTVVQDFCVTPNGPPIVTSLPLRLKNDILSQTNIDANNDGEIQITEAQNVTNLSIISPVIKGLDDFSNIETLNCSTPLEDSFTQNHILYLDVSPLVNLKNLYASGNRLGTIDVTQNVNLERLDCTGNMLNSLLLHNNPNLKWLACGNGTSNQIPLTNSYVNRNTFKTLDVSNNSLLEYINCSYATMDALILGSNANLKKVYCVDNGLSALDVTQLPNLEQLDCGTHDQFFSYNIYYYPDRPANQITSLDVSQNPNLWSLKCNGNLLTALNTSAQGTTLTTLFCNDNPLNTINLSQNTGLAAISCDNTGINTIDTSAMQNLTWLSCSDNALTTLDINQNPNLTRLDCHDNQITQLFVKNGNIFTTVELEGNEFFYQFNYFGNPIEYICADDFEIDQMPSSPNIAVNTYCSFVPGGSYYTIEGTVRFDATGNGCDANDNPYQYINLNITNSTNETSTIAAQNDGLYAFYVSDDDVYTITPVLENPSYFTVSPASIVVNFPTDASPFTQDFCITPNGVYNDLDITLIPLNQARPGFDSNYKLVYKNKGNTILSGTINLMFEDDVMDFAMSNPATATQAANSLQWNYTNLLPFESREITLTMNLNTPTDPFPLNADDVLAFETTITPVAADETMDDNTFELSQIMVNSFDPNDKNCLQGTEVTTDAVGKYVDYMIRFENTGTANAINIVVKDVIETSMFDASTLIVTGASHSIATRFTNANTVEFIFENINLPFDDASNDGYVTFKLKTLPTLVVDDTFENEVEIYFDYNLPITTNRSITLIKDILNTTNFELTNFEIYPNPVEDVFIIKTKETIENITIYDIAGRLVQQTSYTGTQSTIEVSTTKFTQGTYFVKIKTASGATLVKKIVKA